MSFQKNYLILLKQDIMARTVNYNKRAEKIKGAIDELIQELIQTPTPVPSAPKKEKIKLSNIDFEELDLNTLIQIQARISRIILSKSK